ncbi:MAG: metallophosphoesterase [Bdellovibrionota bacterium]|nr:MAG: metallophosphoesterase [Bdellovibrionota bacterium]
MPSCSVEVGINGPIAIRHEIFSSEYRCRILYISDIHLTPKRLPILCERLGEVLAHTVPDLTLLGGDIVDSPRGLLALPELLRRLATYPGPIAAVPGNHDFDAGVCRVSATIHDAGIHWLPDGPFRFRTRSERNVIVHGEMHSNTTADALHILCGHDPEIFSHPLSRRFQLTLAGHYHGGQVILFRRQGKEYPNSWFFPWSGTRFSEGNATLLVSRGVADTLPLRFNCPREVVLCEL